MPARTLQCDAKRAIAGHHGAIRADRLAKRDRSNTPLQALTLMNDPMFMEISDHFGKLLEKAEGSTEEKITLAFRRLLTRPPSPDEVRLLSDFHQKHPSWPALARALLSLDESVTKN